MICPDERTQYLLEQVLQSHETWFDVHRDYSFAHRVFPGYAEFHTHGEKYLLSKRATLWAVNAHEYLFFETVGALDLDRFTAEICFMKTEALKKVAPEKDHMSSSLSLVIIADTVENDVLKAIRKTRFYQSLRFGLSGWIELRVAVMNVQEHSVLTNSAGKQLKKPLEQNLRDSLSRMTYTQQGELCIPC